MIDLYNLTVLVLKHDTCRSESLKLISTRSMYTYMYGMYFFHFIAQIPDTTATCMSSTGAADTTTYTTNTPTPSMSMHTSTTTLYVYVWYIIGVLLTLMVLVIVATIIIVCLLCYKIRALKEKHFFYREPAIVLAVLSTNSL